MSHPTPPKAAGAATGPWALRALHPRRFFLDTWKALDDEAKAEREAAGPGYDIRPLVVLSAVAVLLTLIYTFGRQPGYQAFVAARVATGGADSLWASLASSPYDDLYYRYWWAGVRVLGYLVVPMALIRFGLRQRVRDFGFGTDGLREHAPAYLLAFVAVLGCVVAVSFADSFVAKYPFYRHAGRSGQDLLLWELAYVAQFLSLEFFYRGFMLQSLRPALGSHAIFVMTVPYTMVHFGKPLAETLGAVAAGIFLGTLALRTRSIWSGFFLHVSVALSMDLAALVQKGEMPTTWSF